MSPEIVTNYVIYFFINTVHFFVPLSTSQQWFCFVDQPINIQNVYILILTLFGLIFRRIYI